MGARRRRRPHRRGGQRAGDQRRGAHGGPPGAAPQPRPPRASRSACATVRCGRACVRRRCPTPSSSGCVSSRSLSDRWGVLRHDTARRCGPCCGRARRGSRRDDRTRDARRGQRVAHRRVPRAGRRRDRHGHDRALPHRVRGDPRGPAPERLVVDISRVTFLSAAGVRVFVQIGNRVRRDGRSSPSIRSRRSRPGALGVRLRRAGGHGTGRRPLRITPRLRARRPPWS